MSYLEEFKNRIQEEKEVKIERYKHFMEDYVVTQFVNSLTHNATIHLLTLTSDSVNVDKQDFILWLESEGFTVTTSQNNIIISIP